MHPRNLHQGHYDFQALKKSYPELTNFVAPNKYGDESIDFANAEAVKTLNRALLKKYYDLAEWDIPAGFLCPPVPGRADYIHNMADVLAEANSGKVPRGKSVRVLDIGVGANCIYPIIGHFEYEWSFVGADVNPLAIASAKRNIDSNERLKNAVELRLQNDQFKIFEGIVKSGERFDFTMCNPPFHSSMEEAQMGTRRKWKNLGKVGPKHEKLNVNFGGQGAELWCEGGEVAFIERMIQESAAIKGQCQWFSTLVSKSEALDGFYRVLKKVAAKNWRTLDMTQGQKKSRILLWSFY